MNLILELKGYTNTNVVRCIYNKSPLEFYADMRDDKVLTNQLEILKFAWPNITKNIFLEDVCSSSLEKRVWINRAELIPKDELKIFLEKITLNDINLILKNSLLSDDFNNIKEVVDYFENKHTYPTIKVDFIPLILNKCNPYVAGLQNNTLYYLVKPPKFEMI